MEPPLSQDIRRTFCRLQLSCLKHFWMVKPLAPVCASWTGILGIAINFFFNVVNRAHLLTIMSFTGFRGRFLEYVSLYKQLSDPFDAISSISSMDLMACISNQEQLITHTNQPNSGWCFRCRLEDRRRSN